MRTLKKDIKLGGYDLPAGMSINVPFYNIHLNAAYWDRPTEFLPVSTYHQLLGIVVPWASRWACQNFCRNMPPGT